MRYRLIFTFLIPSLVFLVGCRTITTESRSVPIKTPEISSPENPVKSASIRPSKPPQRSETKPIPSQPRLLINDGKSVTFTEQAPGTTSTQVVKIENQEDKALQVRVNVGAPFYVRAPDSFTLGSQQTREIQISFAPRLTVAESLNLGPRSSVATSVLVASFEHKWQLPIHIEVQGVFNNFIRSTQKVYLTNASIKEVAIPQSVRPGVFFLIPCVTYYDTRLVAIVPKGFRVVGDHFRLDKQLQTATTYVAALRVAGESSSFTVPVFTEGASPRGRMIVLNTFGK